MRTRPTDADPADGFRRAALAHYAVELFLHERNRPVDGLALCMLATATAAAVRPTRYGLVVRHYAWQLPQKFLALELLALQILPLAVRMVVRLRRAPIPAAPSPDPALLRDAVRWFKAMTTSARHRGALDGRWDGRAQRVWAPGFGRRLLRSPAELRAAISACRRSSA